MTLQMRRSMNTIKADNGMILPKYRLYKAKEER